MCMSVYGRETECVFTGLSTADTDSSGAIAADGCLLCPLLFRIHHFNSKKLWPTEFCAVSLQLFAAVFEREEKAWHAILPAAEEGEAQRWISDGSHKASAYWHNPVPVFSA